MPSKWAHLRAALALLSVTVSLLIWTACGGTSSTGDVLVAATRGKAEVTDAAATARLSVFYSGNVAGEIEPCG